MGKALFLVIAGWLICGAGAAWMIEARHGASWKDVALGPIALTEELRLRAEVA